MSSVLSIHRKIRKNHERAASKAMRQYILGIWDYCDMHGIRSQDFIAKLQEDPKLAHVEMDIVMANTANAMKPNGEPNTEALVSYVVKYLPVFESLYGRQPYDIQEVGDEQ